MAVSFLQVIAGAPAGGGGWGTGLGLALGWGKEIRACGSPQQEDEETGEP
eukprot:CAMPEP_0117665658 /NCGR_PEP_ID=MMETSP0804-20121206/9937_1 /TAXON_ID=1074897 /ORGANISM="Tetraselmis astigmatica, Strain CCMP880" /LENGTH=49 /DNA_ID=CAMNT_0005473105 /DNA_START=218 /DNA_END=367 /DNA_ORIENTATION=-